MNLICFCKQGELSNPVYMYYTLTGLIHTLRYILFLNIRVGRFAS